MPFLTATQAAAAAGQTVRQAVLVYFDFVGDPRGYWLGGFGPLLTADGRTWEGTGGLGSVDGLDVPVGTSAPVATFTMSGVDVRVAALARQQSDLVKGRLVQVSVQFYKDDLTLLDAPVVAWTGILDVMTYRGLGGGKYAVSVTAETEWAARNKPPYGYLTDTDQQARFPGDRGLELVASLPGKAINWPV